MSYFSELYTPEPASNGADAVKRRVAAILSHPEAHAPGRERLAHLLAFETDVSVDAAIKVLRAAPIGTALSEPARSNASDPWNKVVAQSNKERGLE